MVQVRIIFKHDKILEFNLDAESKAEILKALQEDGITSLTIQTSGRDSYWVNLQDIVYVEFRVLE